MITPFPAAVGHDLVSELAPDDSQDDYADDDLACEDPGGEAWDTLTAKCVSELAPQLPADYDGPALRVYDTRGFVVGYVRSRSDWRYA